MIPDLQAALLCDDVRQEKNGKFIVIGIFDGITVPAMPFVIQRICLVSRWCCGQGRFEQQSRLLAPDGQQVIAEGKRIQLHLPDTQRIATSVEVFLRLRFNAPGMHWIEIKLDSQLKLRFPLHVRLTAAQGAPPSDGDGAQP